jgi:hypothetical protein
MPVHSVVVVTLAAASCARPSAPPVILHVVREGEACRVELDGHPVTQDRLLVAAAPGAAAWSASRAT